MSETEKLLPCPFCGGEARVCEQEIDACTKQYYVACDECDACSPSLCSKHKAAEAWNRRNGAEGKLLVCSECGGEAELLGESSDNGDVVWWVQCKECNHRTYKWYKKEEAIKEWSGGERKMTDKEKLEQVLKHVTERENFFYERMCKHEPGSMGHLQCMMQAVSFQEIRYTIEWLQEEK